MNMLYAEGPHNMTYAQENIKEAHLAHERKLALAAMMGKLLVVLHWALELSSNVAF